MCIRLTNHVTGLALANVPVSIELHSKGGMQQAVTLKSFLTNAQGIGQPRFEVPDWPDGDYELSIVAQPDGQTEAFLHLVAERNVAERDVYGPERDAPVLVDARRNAEPDGRHTVVRQRAHRLDELREQRILGGRDRGPLVGVVHPTVGVDQPGQDLGPAQVDSDDAVCAHNCRVT